jgi:hypothetical protein
MGEKYSVEIGEVLVGFLEERGVESAHLVLFGSCLLESRFINLN